MKRLCDFQPAELLDLTMDQVEDLISVECAHRGVPLATQCPTPPAPCEAQPDATCYRVNADVRFATREEAEAFVGYLQTLKLLTTESLTSSSWRGPYHLVPHDREFTVAQERHWTPVHHAQHAKALERYEHDKETYDNARREFEKTNGERSSARREVWGAIEEAREAQRTVDNLRSRFEEYCRIADGDKATALKFLLAATPHDEAFVRTTLNIPMEEMEHGVEE